MPVSKTDKLRKKLISGSSLQWTELVTLLKSLGYTVLEGSGSRVKFAKGNRVISLHRPHPNQELKRYMAKSVIEQLQNEGDI